MVKNHITHIGTDLQQTFKQTSNRPPVFGPSLITVISLFGFLPRLYQTATPTRRPRARTLSGARAATRARDHPDMPRGWMKNYGVTYAYLGYDLDGDKDDPLYVIYLPYSSPLSPL